MTTKKWAADQKLEIVLAGLRNEGSTAELCRRYGISHSTFNKWRRLFIEGGQERLSKGPASSREKQLERENEELKQALGEATLELRVLKKLQSLQR